MFKTAKPALVIFTFLSFVATGGSNDAKASNSTLCPEWKKARVVGGLDSDLIDESSGMALSSDGTLLYHTNDSGDSARFFSSDLKGHDLLEHKVTGFNPRDVEALGAGPCGSGEKCLFIGDIGDNKRKRKTIKVVVISEKSIARNARVSPMKTLTVKYPDGAHNAEGLEVHSNGDIYILTKEAFSSYRVAKPAQMFRLKFSDWYSNEGEKMVAENVGSIDFPEINSDLHASKQVVTGLSFHPSGNKFLALTYTNAVEFRFDPAAGLPSGPMVEGRDYRRISLRELEQQEAIVYTSADSEKFLYSTESKNSGSEKAPIYQVNCIR